MDGFSLNLVKLWMKWNVQVTVLLSFMLQVVLIVLAKHRKRDSRLWIRIVTWCAYLSADIVATYALGVIATYVLGVMTTNRSHCHEKNSESMDANTELTAFWVPFLLMHLGGPDTITAYSLEDNELWLRHLLGLVSQVVMAIYVCVMAWTGSLLSFLSLLMLFAGLIKYGERTWVLRKASQEKIRESYMEATKDHVNSTLHHIATFGSNNLSRAYCLMDLCFPPLFLDFDVIWALERIHHGLIQSSVDLDTFQMIEMSLAIMYNNLYTKALLLYTHVGVGLRVITVILTSSVSVLFLVLVDKHKYSKFDVTITFVLLFGAIILEIYSALLVLFSDRFQVWLIKHGLMFEAFDRVLPKSKKRWSNKMSQLSLLSFIMKEKPMPCCNFLKQFSIVQKLENQWYATDIEIPNDLKNLIYTYLKNKRDQTAPNDFEIPNFLGGLNLSKIPSELKNLILTYLKRTAPSEIKIPKYLSGMDLSAIPNDLKKLILTYLETARRRMDKKHVRGIDFTEELDKSILAWHLATEKWYEIDREHVNGEGHIIELICQISRYMFSLLLLHPNMISNANKTAFTLQPVLAAARRSSFATRITACQNLEELLRDAESTIQLQFPNLEEFEPRISSKRFFEKHLPKLLRRLHGQSWEDRWMMISCTWLEMLAYTAHKCRGIQHAQRLNCGGEFLTHVWFLTKHLGFTEKDFKLQVPRWANSIIGFAGASSSR